MLSKEERKERNTLFWNTLKKQMRSVPSCTGRSISWIKYPTDVKDVYLRMETDSKGARLCFEIQPKDDGIRSILWEQMTELKVVMEEEVGEAEWYEFHREFSGRNVSRIQWELKDKNFYKDEDFPAIIEFLKEKLIDFDSFYQEYKEILISLAE